jgi:hypothetical protein
MGYKPALAETQGVTRTSPSRRVIAPFGVIATCIAMYRNNYVVSGFCQLPEP